MHHKPMLAVLAIAPIAVAVLAIAAQPSPAPAPAQTTVAQADPADTTEDLVARGEYLVGIMVCNDCHTPLAMTPEGPAPDRTRLLAGHPEELPVTPAPELGDGLWGWAGASTNTAFAGPWGVSFTANLTPDPETGLGTWTAETFIAALRSGRHEGQGRPILPPMPYPWYRQASDADLRAVFAYLQSIPPIHNRVPQPLDPVGAP